MISGCASIAPVGKRIESSDVSRIHKDKTTKQDVVGIFGPPMSKAFSSAGETWSYGFQSGLSIAQTYKTAYGGGLPSDYTTQNLIITFDGNTVKDFNFSSTGDVSLATNK